MKTIKHLLILTLIFSLTSCDLKINGKSDTNKTIVKQSDTISIKDGDDKLVLLKYNIVTSDVKMLKALDYDLLIKMFKICREEAKNGCKHQLTYNPKDFSIFIEQFNRVIVTKKKSGVDEGYIDHSMKLKIIHTFSAKSSMGVSGLLEITCVFDNQGHLVEKDIVDLEK